MTLYGFYVLILLYPTILLFVQIGSLVLNIIPLPIIRHSSQGFLNHVVPPIIPFSRVSTQCISHCFTLQPLLASNQWARAYNDDLHTKVLIDCLYISTPLDKEKNLHLPAAYRTDIARNLLGLLEGRLVYYEPIATTTNHICRIVVPTSLRRIIFNRMHATTIAGHMGEYKTLYRVRIQFFWPRLRSDVSDWIKQCDHCMITYRWRGRGQELMFSWPVSSPFAILHADRWMPGHLTDPNGYMELMNTMCDMSQFVVVVSVPNESSATLAYFFMQHVLLKFGLCHLVVLDDGSHFQGAFIAMYDALSLNYDVLAKRNHKGLTVEYFHCVLNKSVNIAAEDRGTNDFFPL